MLKKTTQLTKDGIKNLMEKNYKNSYFQMIEMNNLPARTNMPTTTSEKPAEKFKVMISDGYAKTKTFFASEACQMIKTGVATNFCVFEIISAVINISDKTMIIIVKISVIYDDITDIIGKPLEFDEYKKLNFQNPNGSINIPISNEAANVGNEDIDYNSKKETFNSKTEAINTKIPPKINKPNPNFNNQLSNQNQNQGGMKPFSVMNKIQNSNANSGFSMNQNANDDEDNLHLMTIAMLSPVCDANWKIKARVLKKNEIKQYKTAKGEGSFFSIEIMDRNQTEINCSFFNAGCDKWFDYLNEGNIYIFSGGLIRENNSRYNSKNDYQISFDERSTILVSKDDGTILRQKFVFVKMNQISELPVGTQVDVIAIIKDPGECNPITLKSGEVKSKRAMHLFDDSMAAVEMTLWGDLAGRDFATDSIVIFKQVKINEFGGNRNLSSMWSTQIISDLEDLPEYQALSSWYKQTDSKAINISVPEKSGSKITKFKSLLKLEEESAQKLLDVNDKIFSDVKAYVVFIRNSETTTLYYLSCPTEKCMRKVIEESDGWRCEKCNKTFPEPIARFILSAKISDDTGSAWVSIYDPTASGFIGKSANEIKILKEQGQFEIINNFFKNLQCVELRMRIMSKMEMYNGETKVKHQILKIVPKDFIQENNILLSQIETFLQK